MRIERVRMVDANLIEDLTEQQKILGDRSLPGRRAERILRAECARRERGESRGNEDAPPLRAAHRLYERHADHCSNFDDAPSAAVRAVAASRFGSVRAARARNP